jgi:hypothetical protein
MTAIKRILNRKTIYVAAFSLCLCVFSFFITNTENGSVASNLNTGRDEYVSYIDGYDDYINSILESAERTKDFSVFSNNKFVAKNIEKTYNDYHHIADVQPVATNTSGFDRYITYISIISAFVFFILLYCLFNSQKEYENGEIIFSYSTRNGRFLLALKRNILYTAMAVIFAVIFNAIIMILSGLWGGFPNFFSPVQSSMLFKNCTVKLTILEFLFLNIVETSLGISVLTMLTNTLFNLVRNKYVSIVSAGAIFFAEYKLSVLAQNNSANIILANINIFKLLDFSTYYRNYQNINVFGEAVSSLDVMLAVVFMLYVIFSLGSAIAYKYRRPVSKVRFGKLADHIQILNGKICAHCGFLGLELYKIYIRKKKIFLIIILMSAEIILVSGTKVTFPERQLLMDNTYNEYGGENWQSFENYLDEYRNTIECRNNEIIELKSLINEQEEAQENIRKISQVSSEVAEMEKILEEYEEVWNRKNEIKERTGITVYAMSDRGYNEIFGNNSAVREIGIMVIMVLIAVVLGAGYYMEELQSGVIKLLRSSKQGVRKMFTKKFWIIFVSVFFLIVILLGVDYYELHQMYEFKYLNAPIVSLKFMEKEMNSLFAGISIWQYILIDIVFKMSVPMVTLVITLLCSLKLKTLFFAPIIAFLAALGGSLGLFAGIAVKIVLIMAMMIFLVYSVGYVIRGKYENKSRG